MQTVAWACAAPVVVAIVVLTARPAAAQTADDEAPAQACSVTEAGSTANASLVPDDCWGRFPSSSYDIGCDEGAWNHISRKIYCTFTDLAFQGARTTTATALWLVEWTYGFGVYDRLGQPMIGVADRYRRELIGPFGLNDLAWTYAIAWCAIAGLRGKLTMAGGELVTSIVLAALAGMLLANPAGYLDGAFTTMRGLSAAVLSTGTGQPPPDDPGDTEAVLAPLQAQIHQAFVEEPYDHINWGGALTGACADARDQILADGPHGNDNEPRQLMDDAGCEAQSEFNHEPSGQRLYGAVLTLVAAVIVVVLVVLISVTILVAQVAAVLLFAVAPFAALGAVLPGSGREIAWRWVAGLIRAGLVVVAMSFVLSLTLLSVDAMLASGDGDGDGLIERFTLVNLVVVGMFIARKRIVSTGAHLASQVGSRLSSRRAGGEHAAPWLGPAAIGGVSGYAVGASLGLDPRSRTGRLTSLVVRDHMAERRLRRHYQRAERKAQRPVVRERTELVPGGEGQVVERRSVTVDGPAIKPGLQGTVRGRYGWGSSARARRARNKVEASARRRADEFPAQRGWTSAPPDSVGWDTPPVDPEEA